MVSANPTLKLLNWYDDNRRVLPWRALPGQCANPYHVWLSEIMLQQTTVATVKGYFQNFIDIWPTVHDLAAAKDDTVMAAWAGLGYYARARNLLKCARLVVAQHNGEFPTTEDELRTLPGIGPYTAAAIAAIAFNQVAAPVDGNIERVLARLTADKTPLPALKARVKQANAALVPPARPGDFAQAMMDLGATVCTPKRPRCDICPWQAPCQARAQDIQEILPRRAPKTPKPQRNGTVYWLENTRKEVLMARRPDKGLLGGMLMFPSKGWDAANDTALGALLPDGWTKLNGEVTHVFTHFRLTLKLVAQTAPKGFRKPAGYEWVNPREFPNRALPSVMRKVAMEVLEDNPRRAE
jgi:A/G-specific adenine glycosylase